MAPLRLIAAAACLLPILAACASSEPVTATPRSIVFPDVDEKNIVEVTQKAEEFCLKYGLHAQAVADGRPRGRATFHCVQ